MNADATLAERMSTGSFIAIGDKAVIVTTYPTVLLLALRVQAPVFVLVVVVYRFNALAKKPSLLASVLQAASARFPKRGSPGS